MNLHFFKLDALEKELEQLPPLHRIACAASCCERLLPNYNAFSRMENWGDPSILRNALDEVWQILRGKPVDTSIIHQLREDCNSNDVIPDDRFCDSYYVFEAQEAAFAICNVLDACLDPLPEHILEVVIHLRDTIEAFAIHIDESFKVGLKLSPFLDYSEEYMQAVSRHPFAVREIAKQREDLQRLKEVGTLDREFLEWLRTSFDNDGRSVIDVS